jgi:hypothetical protein
LIAAVSGEVGWNIVRVSRSVGGCRTPLTVSAAGAADMMRPAVKKRAMRVVVMSVSLARRGRGGVLDVVGGVVGRGRGVVLVGVTRTAGGASMSGVGGVVVLLRLRSDKIGGNSVWEVR